MKKILLTAFGIRLNSSKIFVDKIKSNVNKIVFQNDYFKSENSLINELKNNCYDYIISFGQKPITKSIYIEIRSTKNNSILNTNFDYIKLFEFLEEEKYKVKISSNAGRSLCNHVYFEGLNYIYSNNLKTKMIFIHIPYSKNLEDIDKLSFDIDKFLSNLIV